MYCINRSINILVRFAKRWRNFPFIPLFKYSELALEIALQIMMANCESINFSVTPEINLFLLLMCTLRHIVTDLFLFTCILNT